MYPVAYQADYVEKRSRLTTFFRFIVAIPWLLVAYFWGLVALVGVVVGWFAIVITGKFPDGVYNLVAMALRYNTRINSWIYLMTDAWPSFGGGEDPEYPVRLVVPAPLPAYSRWKTLLRLILAIPVMIMAYLFSLLVGIVGILSWIVIVVTGKHPEGLFDVMKMGLAYQAKAHAYMFLVTETYPPISEDGGTAAEPAAPAAPPPPSFGS